MKSGISNTNIILQYYKNAFDLYVNFSAFLEKLG